MMCERYAGIFLAVLVLLPTVFLAAHADSITAFAIESVRSTIVIDAGIRVLYSHFDGNTTDFDSMSDSELEQIENMTLEIQDYGKIIFNENVNLTEDARNNIVDLDSNVNISYNFIEINTTALTSLEKTATILFYNLSEFNYTSLDDYDILNDGNKCTETTSPSCVKINYNPVEFNVSQYSGSFSTQKIKRRWNDITTPEGIFEPFNSTLVGTHVNNFNITVVNATLNSTSEVLRCFVKYPNGSLITFEKTGIEVHGVNLTFNYTLTSNDNIVNDQNAGYLPWVFKNCSLWNSSGSLIYSQQKPARIYVHDPVYWSDNEITRAVTCEGTPGVYFNNTGKCEFSEDTLFALQMRNGNPVNSSCFNNPGKACADSYCNGIFFPTCDPIEYFAGYSPQSDDPNGYTEFIASFAGYNTPIAYTYYTNPEGVFKLRVGPQNLNSKSFSVTLYNLTNVDSGLTNVYGPSSANGTLSVTDQGDGTWSVAYYNFSEFTGQLDFVFNVSFASSFNDLRRLKIVIAYGTDTNQGNPPHFNANFSTSLGLHNNNESESSDATNDAGGVCGDEANNDFDYLGGAWAYSYDCFDADCNMSQGDDSQSNEFGSGKTGKCNYNVETNCSDEFDNDYDYVLGTDFTDCHDADCFHKDLNYCPLKETICNDGINNDWDYTFGEGDASSDMKIENNGTKYDNTHKADITDCEDIDCNWSIGGSSGEICTWGYERNCTDNFDNDALQLYDCQLASLPGTTAMATPAYGEYDCAGYCRENVRSSETGSLCDDNLDNDWDAVSISGYYSDQYSQNSSYGSGIDCRWGGYFGYGSDFNPDEDCNMTILSSGHRCELAREYSCSDGFDNDFDKDASGMPSAGWSNNPYGYQAYYGRNYVEDADGDDYDCQSNAPQTEAFEPSWCFDGVDNDLDAYYWSGGSWVQNTSTGIDCSDPDCIGVTNPANPSQTCLSYEYNATDSFFSSLSYPGFYCDNGLDDDADGPKDCADSDCFKQFDMCSQGPCYETENITWNSCADGEDNDYADGEDCADSDCAGMLGNTSGDYCENAETTCNDGFDNDADGNADCADSECANRIGGSVNGVSVYCRPAESSFSDCYDGFDNDADGYIDCYDSGCDAVCNLTSVNGASPINLPQWAGQTSINSVTEAYIQDYTEKIRRGQWYNITFKMTSASSDAQWTLGTASGGRFNKSAFNASSAYLAGPNAADFTLVETVNGYIIDSNNADLPNGYVVTFMIQSNTTLIQSSYEVTYAEAEGSKTSLNNYIYHEIVEDEAPEISIIRIAPNATNISYGDNIWLRANATDNNAMGLCEWVVYGAENHVLSNSTACSAGFAPSAEGIYHINATPVDYYGNIGSPKQITRNINILPSPHSIETDKVFYRFNETIEFNATFDAVSSDNLGLCRVYLENSTLTKEIASFAANDNSCYADKINISQISGIGDGIYKIYAAVSETTEGDFVYGSSKAIFICSQVDNGTCGYADFNADGKADLCPLPPEFYPVGDILLNKNFGVFYLNLTDNVSDERTSDKDLEFTWVKNATGVFNMSINNDTNIVNFTSLTDAVGSREVTITVIDEHNLTNSTTFTVTVAEESAGGEEGEGGAGGGGGGGGIPEETEEEAPVCGNGVCELGEDEYNCPEDCITAVCGNGVCELGENENNCPQDCKLAVCGNGVCELGEDEYNCPEDCLTELQICIDQLMSEGLTYEEAKVVCEEGEEESAIEETPAEEGPLIVKIPSGETAHAGRRRKEEINSTIENNTLNINLGREGMIKIEIPPNASKPKIVMDLNPRVQLHPAKYDDWLEWLIETIIALSFILLITGGGYLIYSIQRKILYEYIAYGSRTGLFRKSVIRIKALNDLRAINERVESVGESSLRKMHSKVMVILVQYISAVYGIDAKNIREVAKTLHSAGVDKRAIKELKNVYSKYHQLISANRRVSKEHVYGLINKVREIINTI